MPTNRKIPKNISPEPSSNLLICFWPLSYSHWGWWATQLWRPSRLHLLGLGAGGQSLADLIYDPSIASVLGVLPPVLAGVNKDTSSSVRVSSAGVHRIPRPTACPPIVSQVSPWDPGGWHLNSLSKYVCRTCNWLSSIEMSSSFFNLVNYLIGIVR